MGQGAWAGLTPEERKEKTRKLREVGDRQRAERGLPPYKPTCPRMRTTAELRAIQRTSATRGEINERIHSRPVIGSPKKGGNPIRYRSAKEAARALVAQGRAKSQLAAQQKIGLVFNGHRKSAFGYFWCFGPRLLKSLKSRPRQTHFPQTPS